MKIVKKHTSRFCRLLADASPGDCIQFERNFHQKHKAEAYFIVLRLPTQYLTDTAYCGSNRVMVANLDHGDCSLVTCNRAIRFVNAKVVTE